MNENLKQKIEESKKSVYHISKKTGIPYTTLSELMNEKIDINNCAAHTAYKLSLFLNCKIEDILNQELPIINVSGIHNGVKYQWKKGSENNVDLHIWDRGKELIIDSGNYVQPRFFIVYDDMTELLIDCYLQKKKAEEYIDD